MFNFKTIADMFKPKEKVIPPQVQVEVKPEPKVVDSGAVKARSPKRKAK
jgi:hypothetical protein